MTRRFTRNRRSIAPVPMCPLLELAEHIERGQPILPRGNGFNGRSRWRESQRGNR